MIIPFSGHPDPDIKTCEEALKNIITAARTKKSSVFCGAGISFASGLPVVSSLLNYIFPKLDLTSKQKWSIHNCNIPFESIMEIILRESGLDEIQEIFSAGIPNTNHIFLAKMAKQGYFKIIYTTNFDTLIEQAFDAEGLLSGSDFDVYSSETELKSVVWDNDRIKLIKIHGCVSKKEDMAITMSLIASERYSIMRKNLMSKIFNANECDNVIILGYSCSDLDLTSLIESFEGKKANIFFVEHQSPSIKCHSEHVALKEFKNPFAKYNGTRILLNTDELIKQIWNHVLNENYYRIPQTDTKWKENIDLWYFNSVQNSGSGVKHHIAGRLLYAIGAFNEAIDHNSKAIAIARRDGNLIAYSSEVGNLGMAFNASGNHELATSCFNESIPLCKRIGNVENLASQLQSFGNVLHHTGDDTSALKMHNEALTYTHAGKDDFLISNILGNMSNSYNRLGQYDNALKSLDKALILSRDIGNKQAESSQLGILAVTYLCMEHYEQALQYCLQGLDIKRTIADKHGECGMLGNLVTIYRLLGLKDKTLETAKFCLDLAKQIGNTHIQEMVKINLELLNSPINL